MFLGTQNIKVAPMKWEVSNRDFWDNPNCYTFIDDFYYNNHLNRLYIRYDVGITANLQGEEQAYVFAQFPNSHFSARVGSIEDGMKLAEQKRKEYFESFLQGLLDNIFVGG